MSLISQTWTLRNGYEGNIFGHLTTHKKLMTIIEMQSDARKVVFYEHSVSHFQPLTPTPALGLARVLTSLEEMP